ncbi:PKD domain-containing protein, partial [Thiolapillus sp.]
MLLLSPSLVSANQPPSVDAGEDRIVHVTEQVRLDGSATADADGDALRVVWEFVSKPTGSAAVLQDITTFSPYFSVDVPGRYEIGLRVSDGIVPIQTDTVVIRTENSAPDARIQTASPLIEGKAILLDGGASEDVDGDVLSYQWTFQSRPEGSRAVIWDARRALAGFVPDKPGSYRVSLAISDGVVQDSAS